MHLTHNDTKCFIPCGLNFFDFNLLVGINFLPWKTMMDFYWK